MDQDTAAQAVEEDLPAEKVEEDSEEPALEVGYDFLVPSRQDWETWSPDPDDAPDNTRRVFTFEPLADQTLNEIVSTALVRTAASTPILAHQAAQVPMYREIVSMALRGWENMTDQRGRPVLWESKKPLANRNLIGSMSRKLLEELGEHIYNRSLSVGRAQKKT
jgi:hypothetical protein